MQAVGAGLGMGQGLIAGGAFGHARHLQVGLDRGQRAAQLMGRVAGQPPLALDGLADALEQLVLGIEQRLQLAGQRLHLQGFEGIRAAPHQRVAHPVERCQALAESQPEQAQAAEQGDADRHRGGQQDRQVQGLALDLAIGGGDMDIAADQGEGAPGRAVDHLVMETDVLRFQVLFGVVVTARQHFPAQGTDLAGHAAADIQLFGAEMRAPVLARHRRQLLQQPGHHARRRHQALVEGEHHLMAQVAEHPGRGQGPDQDEGRTDGQAQAQAQAHHAYSSPSPAGPRR